jgi:hypothetical protein
MSSRLPQSVLNTNCMWIPTHFNCGDVYFLSYSTQMTRDFENCRL